MMKSAVMIEVHGDLWAEPANLYVITTNGAVRRDGAAVMGRGVALQAKQRFSGIERKLGAAIRSQGNHVHWLGLRDDSFAGLMSFPVKHHWREPADLALIEQSAGELVKLLDDWCTRDWETYTVAMPRPGCGNGQLDWVDVAPLLVPMLDDRFVIVNNEGES